MVDVLLSSLLFERGRRLAVFQLCSSKPRPLRKGPGARAGAGTERMVEATVVVVWFLGGWGVPLHFPGTEHVASMRSSHRDLVL